MKQKKIECPKCETTTLSLIGILKYRGIANREFECSNCKNHFHEIK